MLALLLLLHLRRVGAVQKACAVHPGSQKTYTQNLHRLLWSRLIAFAALQHMQYGGCGWGLQIERSPLCHHRVVVAAAAPRSKRHSPAQQVRQKATSPPSSQSATKWHRAQEGDQAERQENTTKQQHTTAQITNTTAREHPHTKHTCHNIQKTITVTHMCTWLRGQPECAGMNAVSIH